MIKIEWLRNAYYNDKYVTDGILFIDRSKIYVPDGYRKITVNTNKIDDLFSYPLCNKINTSSNITRTYAKTSITRYPTNNGYVVLNDEYKYLWKYNDLYTLKQNDNLQYVGPVGIVNKYGLFAIVSPIQVQNINDVNYWINIDKLIGIK